MRKKNNYPKKCCKKKSTVKTYVVTPGIKGKGDKLYYCDEHFKFPDIVVDRPSSPLVIHNTAEDFIGSNED